MRSVVIGFSFVFWIVAVKCSGSGRLSTYLRERWMYVDCPSGVFGSLVGCGVDYDFTTLLWMLKLQCFELRLSGWDGEGLREEKESYASLHTTDHHALLYICTSK